MAVNLPQRFTQRLSRLNQQAGRAALRLAFTHAAGTPAVSGALRACFDQLTRDYLLPDAWLSTSEASFCLTPAGDGLRIVRQATGAVRGDAYTDYLDLLIAGQLHIDVEIAEDSYQPELILTLSAANEKILDQAVPVLEQLMRAAGCQPVAV